MKLSSKTHYGVQILTILGTQNKTLSAKDLERYTGVSSKYLEKVLKILLSVGAIKATRGALGGYSLAKAADEIKMGEVVRALEDNRVRFEKRVLLPVERAVEKTFRGYQRYSRRNNLKKRSGR